MRATRLHPALRAAHPLVLGCVTLAVLAAPLAADVEVLVDGASRRILARSGDSLQGGGVLREKLDKVYWLPGPFNDFAYLFVNHELTVPNGGLSRLRYDAGVITERLSWVSGTHFNCSGIVTRWRTILSCEEHPPADSTSVGHVLEVSTTQPGVYWRRTALGRFSHEGIVEDPVTGDYYLTDDSYTGVFFRFVPAVPGDLSAGLLYALNETTRSWLLVTDMVYTEEQAIALGATTHPRPEDLVYSPVDDAIYIAVTGTYSDPNSRLGYILRFNPRTREMTRWLDGDGAVLANPDNLEVDSYGSLLVHEDQYPQNVALYGPNELLLVYRDRVIVPVLRGLDTWGEVTGMEWGGHERRFFINWMGGANGSELIEVNCPYGWNRPVGVEPAPPPAGRELRLAVAPNPFRQATRLRADLGPGAPAAVRLEIVDARGARWRTLHAGPLPGRELDVVWNGRDERGRSAPPGVYFARLVTPERRVATKLLLLR